MPDIPYLTLPAATNLAATDTLLGVSSPSSSPVAGQFSLDQLSAYFKATGAANYNYAINGAFQSAINGTAISTVANGVDMWGIHDLGTGGVVNFTRAQFTNGLPAQITGSKNALYGDWTQTTAGTVTEPTMRFLLDAALRDLADDWITISYWAQSNVALSSSLMVRQNFGQGGSPSANVDSSRFTVNTTNVWQKFVHTYYVPSIVGKTFGTTGNTAHYRLFWIFPMGQTFSFRITQVKVEKGQIATPFVFEDESYRIHKYYQSVPMTIRTYAPVAGAIAETNIPFWRPMRGIPVPTITSGGQRLNLAATYPLATGLGTSGGRYMLQSAAIGDMYDIQSSIKLDAMI